VADRVRHFEVTEAGGSGPTTQSVYAVQIDTGVVRAVEVHLPAGHGGQTGIRVSYGAIQVIPEYPDDYFHGNRRTIRRELSDVFPTGGAWFVEVYNAGRYPHVFHADFEVDLIDLATAVDALPPVLLLLPDPAGGGDTAPTTVTTLPPTVAPPGAI
jgi:hypothetical protein